MKADIENVSKMIVSNKQKADLFFFKAEIYDAVATNLHTKGAPAADAPVTPKAGATEKPVVSPEEKIPEGFRIVSRDSKLWIYKGVKDLEAYIIPENYYGNYIIRTDTASEIGSINFGSKVNIANEYLIRTALLGDFKELENYYLDESTKTFVKAIPVIPTKLKYTLSDSSSFASVTGSRPVVLQEGHETDFELEPGNKIIEYYPSIMAGSCTVFSISSGKTTFAIDKGEDACSLEVIYEIRHDKQKDRVYIDLFNTKLDGKTFIK